MQYNTFITSTKHLHSEGIRIIPHFTNCISLRFFQTIRHCPQRKECQKIELSFCHFVTPRFLSDRFILYTILLCISFRF